MKTLHKILPAFLSALIVDGYGSAFSLFDSTNENWTAIGDSRTAGSLFNSGGGNPGGTIQINDATTGGIWYWSAPENYHGDHIDVFGSQLTFDLRQEFSGNASQFDSDDIIIEGGGITIVYDLANNPDLTGEWTSYAVILDATGDWKIDSRTGVDATDEQIQNVLGAITSLRIRGEYRSGSDTGYLDNVFFGANSIGVEPNVTIFMLAGLEIEGTVGAHYMVEYSLDLNDWTLLTSLVLPESPFLFIDTESLDSPRRFYRAFPVNPDE